MWSYYHPLQRFVQLVEKDWLNKEHMNSHKTHMYVHKPLKGDSITKVFLSKIFFQISCNLYICPRNLCTINN